MLDTTSDPVILRSRKEAAAALRISVRKLDYLIERGEITPVRIDGRVLVAWSELVRFVEAKTREGGGSSIATESSIFQVIPYEKE